MAKVSNIDLNRASAQEIAEADIPQVSLERANDLVEYREENGPFQSWDDVKRVPGFSQGMIDNLRQSGVTLGGTRPEESGGDTE